MVYSENDPSIHLSIGFVFVNFFEMMCLLRSCRWPGIFFSDDFFNVGFFLSDNLRRLGVFLDGLLRFTVSFSQFCILS